VKLRPVYLVISVSQSVKYRRYPFGESQLMSISVLKQHLLYLLIVAYPFPYLFYLVDPLATLGNPMSCRR
jgi:hypothetical protein